VYLQSVREKKAGQGNLHTGAMTHPPRINIYAVAGKEKGHRRGQMQYHNVCYVAAAIGEKARLG